jgi:hypothetical protein
MGRRGADSAAKWAGDKAAGARENDGPLEVLLLLGRPTVSARKSGRMKQVIRELKRQVAGEKLELEQLKGLIRALRLPEW